MKVRTALTGLLLVLGLIAGIYAAHSQTSDGTGQPVMTDPNEDVSNLSDLQVELKALEMATPLAASNAPSAGNFYSAQHAPGSAEEWPPLPANMFNLPIWPLDTNVFIIDDLNFNYDGDSAKVLKGSSGTVSETLVRADDEGPPTPPGGGSGGDTNLPPTPHIIPQDYGTNLYVSQWSMVSNTLTGIATNTLYEVEYSVQTNSDLRTTNWADTGQLIEGSAATNWTRFILPPPFSTNNLFFRLQSQVSSDGSGLPNWWELKYFGTTGINPNAQDSAGDGYTVYQKYEMGLNPGTFSTPLAPQGVNVTYNNTTGAVTITWLPSPGDVTGYTVTDSNGNSFNVSTNSFTETIAYSPNFDGTYGNPTMQDSFEVQAHYPDGSSPVSAYYPLQPTTVFGTIIPGPSGGNLLAVAAVPFNAAYVRIFMYFSGYRYIDGQGDNPFTIETNLDIPVTEFTNGIYPASLSWLTPQSLPAGTYTYYHSLYLQSVYANGNCSGGSQLAENWGPDGFYDGREQLKQNLVFQFRIADSVNPFGFVGDTNLDNGFYASAMVTNPPGYVYAPFYDGNNFNFIYGSQLVSPTLNPCRPFQDNELYRNFAVYAPGDIDTNGIVATGLVDDYLDPDTYLNFQIPLVYMPTANVSGVVPLLDTNTAKWLCTFPAGLAYDNALSLIDREGFYSASDVNGNPTLNFSNNAVNYWGIPYSSAKVFYNDYSGNLESSIIEPGGTIDTFSVESIYMNTLQPKLRLVEYDFLNDGFYGGSTNDYADVPSGLIQYPNIPGATAFSPAITNSPLLTSVGQSINVAAFAKLEVTNSVYSGVYGYLQQYLDKAYQIDDNGNVMTNATGIVSPYGNYFPTQAGAAAIVTMPDPDTGERGTGIVYAVSLNVDKNHDGTMDLSWNGPDTTSPTAPYVFWCNNNFDRWDDDGAFGTPEQDDVEPGNGEDTDRNADPDTPDCNYHNLNGDRAIPDTRDLEDFARLWVCGVTPTLVSNLPYGSTATFSWGDVGAPNANNPTIDLFQGGDGSIEYLTNETVASELIDPAVYPRVGRVGPGQIVQLPASLLENAYGRNHLIWCGVTNGSGRLALTIADANSNVLATAWVYIKIVDIKQMYERWTVGDDPNVTPLTNAVPLTEGLPPGLAPFQYSPPITNTPYILHVHGYNMTVFAKDHFGETEYKRLYWQGYQGRFGAFDWPTAQNAIQFGNSESQAWLSARGLLNKLEDLNDQYPGQVYMTVHSLGNVVAGEALRLATHQVVNTYVAMQGAVASQAYDPTTTTRYLGLSYNGDFNYYAHYWTTDAPCYFNSSAGAGKYANFYNTNDWALSVAWLAFESAKPILNPYYSYGGPNLYYYTSNSVQINLSFPTNTYELFANVIQAQCYALGMQINVGGAFQKGGTPQEVDLQSLWTPDPSGANYTEHVWHSGEFRSDTVQNWRFWQRMLTEMDLN